MKNNTCGFCVEPCGNEWCFTMSKKKKLTKQDKINLIVKAMKCNEGQAETWLNTENIGLRTSKHDKTGIKPNKVSDDILRDYLYRIENKESILDAYIKEDVC